MLKAQGKIPEPDPRGPAPAPRGPVIGRHPVVDARSWALPGCTATSPRLPAASWKLDLHTDRAPPRRVLLHCAARSNSMAHAIRTSNREMVFSGLAPGCTVGELRELVRSQLLPGPHTSIVLESWGCVLEDEAKTLFEYSIKDDSKLQVRLVERPAAYEGRGLSRLRISCSALEMRAVDVAPNSSGADLKRTIESTLARGQYEWWDANGDSIRISNGATIVVAEARPEDEAAGTSMVTLGEELIVDGSQASVLRAGKGVAKAVRMVSGTACYVVEPMVAFLNLPAEMMTVSVGGTPLLDTDSLWALGCRTDDDVTLEFESPALPDILKLMRGPEPEKKEKGGKGKKKK